MAKQKVDLLQGSTQKHSGGGEGKNDRAGFVRYFGAASTFSKNVGAGDSLLDLLQSAALLLKGNLRTGMRECSACL